MSTKGRCKCKVVWRGEQTKRVAREAMGEALIETAKTVLSDVAEKQLAPLMYGTLLNSGRVTIGGPADPEEAYKEALSGTRGTPPTLPPSGTSPKIDVHVSFSTPYARRLHEDMTWKPRDWYYSISENRRKKGEGTRETEREKGEREDNGRRGKPVNGKNIKHKDPIGGPKYLEKAIPERWAKFERALKAAMKRLDKKKGSA